FCHHGDLDSFPTRRSSDLDERYHFEKATRAACDYLKTAYARFGNWTSVAASYNMGIAGLTRRKNEQRVPDYYNLFLNEETSRYIDRKSTRLNSSHVKISYA